MTTLTEALQIIPPGELPWCGLYVGRSRQAHAVFLRQAQTGQSWHVGSARSAGELTELVTGLLAEMQAARAKARQQPPARKPVHQAVPPRRQQQQKGGRR